MAISQIQNFRKDRVKMNKEEFTALGISEELAKKQKKLPRKNLRAMLKRLHLKRFKKKINL